MTLNTDEYLKLKTDV